MSESDGFLREIEEELKADRARRQLKIWGPWVLGAVLAVVIGTASYSLWKNWTHKRYEQNSFELQTSLYLFTEGKTLAALEGLKGDFGDTLSAKFLKAAYLENVSEAVAIYNEIIAATDTPETYRGLATLLSVWRQYDEAEPAALRAKLSSIMEPTSPWRHLGRELDLLLASKMGDMENAQTQYENLLTDGATPADVRARLDIYKRHFKFTVPQKQAAEAKNNEGGS